MLDLTLSRESLREILAATAGTIATRDTIPVLNCIRIEAVAAALVGSTTNLDVSTRYAVPAEVSAAGNLCVLHRKLSEIAREMPGDSVRLVQKAGALHVTCGKSNFRLPTLPADEFPKLPAVTFSGTARVRAALLHELVELTAFAASTEETRPILNGVNVEFRQGKIRMVATNGHKLALHEVPAEHGVEPSSRIVPPKALTQAARLFDAADEVEIGGSETHLALRGISGEVTARLIQGPYPNYEQVIPTDQDKTLVVDRETLTAAVRRMAILANEKSPRMAWSLETGRVRLDMETPDLGKANEELAGEYVGAPLKIDFSPSYALELLRTMRAKTVRIRLKAPARPAILEPVDPTDEGRTSMMLMMPIGR